MTFQLCWLSLLTITAGSDRGQPEPAAVVDPPGEGAGQVHQDRGGPPGDLEGSQRGEPRPQDEDQAGAGVQQEDESEHKEEGSSNTEPAGGKQTTEEDQQPREEGRGSRIGGETQRCHHAAGLQRQRVQGKISIERCYEIKINK